MLANNNVSAGRVVTRMQFDPKSSVPKLLFSPAAAVNAEDIEVLQKQAKSSPAEQAIKLTVYQTDSKAEEPVKQAQPEPVQTEEVVEEPVVRKESEPVEKANDISDIMNKWATKD